MQDRRGEAGRAKLADAILGERVGLLEVDLDGTDLRPGDQRLGPHADLDPAELDMRVGEPRRERQALERAAAQDLLEGGEPVDAKRQSFGLELACGLLPAPRGDLLVDQVRIAAADEDVRDRPVGGAELRRLAERRDP